MTRNDRILADLSRHLHDRVSDQIEDFMDRCKTAGLSYHHSASELMVFFSLLAAGYAAYRFEIDEVKFLELMRSQFQRALKAVEDES